MSELDRLLAEHGAPCATTYSPQRFRLDAEQDVAALEDLLRSSPDLTVVDTLAMQLEDLARADLRLKHPAPQQLNDAVQALLGPAPPSRHGTWVFYPWKQTLVHLLPQQQFRRLRLNRNLHKITEDEQRVLAKQVIAIVGLSVGRSALSTLVTEGVGGAFRLCDHDCLDLSNLNRLRAAVSEIGLSKAVLAAREAFEIDPYLDITLYPDGATEDSLTELLSGCTLLVEECDDFAMKVRLREVARDLRLPVVMETSDRGMLDLERFDLEPQRPVFHGLLGSVDAAELRGLGNRERVPYVLRILDSDRISTRLAASLAEVEETTYTWPQLSSAVALGGALVCEAARRIFLAQLTASGRFYVDLEALLDPSNAVVLDDAPAEVTPCTQARAERVIETAPHVSGVCDAQAARFMVEHGMWAPSGGNSQPWHFVLREGRLTCHENPQRSRTFLDGSGFGAALALGAALENVRLAAGKLGLRAQVSEQAGQEGPRAEVSFERGEVCADPLLAHVTKRCTHRHNLESNVLSKDRTAALTRASQRCGLSLRVVTTERSRLRLGGVLGEVDRLRCLIKPYHEELFDEVRWTAEDVLQTRTGIDVHSLELSAGDQAGLRVAGRWDVAAFLRTHSLGGALRTMAHRAAAGCGGIGLLSMPSEMSVLQGGMRLQRLWLEACSLGLAFHPWAPGMAMLSRARRGEGLSLSEAGAICDQMELLVKLWELPPGHVPLFIFRILEDPPAPTSISLRLPLERILTLA